MPNWCSNAIDVEASDDFDRGERALLFDKIEQWKKNLIATRVKDSRSLFERLTKPYHVAGLFGIWFDTPEHLHSINDFNGGWYEWNIANWGTKWDVYENTEISRDEWRLNFDTAWSPPIPFVEKLSKLYPTLTFTVAYSEQGSAFFGTTVIQNGNIISQEDYEARVIYGEDGENGYCAEPEWQEHMDKYGLHMGG